MFHTRKLKIKFNADLTLNSTSHEFTQRSAAYRIFFTTASLSV